MKHDPQRGVALITAMWILILMATGSALLLTRTTTVRQEQVVETARHAAFWAVEGALETVRAALLRGPQPEQQTLTIAEHEVEITVIETTLGWRVHARTVPTVAEIDVELQRAETEGDVPRIVRWQRRR